MSSQLIAQLRSAVTIKGDVVLRLTDSGYLDAAKRNTVS